MLAIENRRGSGGIAGGTIVGEWLRIPMVTLRGASLASAQSSVPSPGDP